MNLPWSFRYTAAVFVETDYICRAETGLLDHSVEAIIPCDDKEVVGSGKMLHLALNGYLAFLSWLLNTETFFTLL